MRLYAIVMCASVSVHALFFSSIILEMVCFYSLLLFLFVYCSIQFQMTDAIHQIHYTVFKPKEPIITNSFCV